MSASLEILIGREWTTVLAGVTKDLFEMADIKIIYKACISANGLKCIDLSLVTTLLKIIINVHTHTI